MYPHGYAEKNAAAMYVGLLSAPVYEESFLVHVMLSVRHRDQDIWVSTPKQPMLRDGGDESTKRWVGQAAILPFDTLARLPEPSILEFVATVQLRTASQLGAQPVMTSDVRRQRILRSDWMRALESTPCMDNDEDKADKADKADQTDKVVPADGDDTADRLTLHSQAIVAHRRLLAVRAPTMLQAWRAWDRKRREEKSATTAPLPLLNEYDPLALKCVLAYLYTADIVLQEVLTVAQALDVLAVSVRYELWPLVAASAAAVGAFVSPGNVAKVLYRVNRLTNDERLQLPDAYAQHGVCSLRHYLSRYIDAHSSEVVAYEIARLTKEVSSGALRSEEKNEAPLPTNRFSGEKADDTLADKSSPEENKAPLVIDEGGIERKAAVVVP